MGPLPLYLSTPLSTVSQSAYRCQRNHITLSSRQPPSSRQHTSSRDNKKVRERPGGKGQMTEAGEEGGMRCVCVSVRLGGGDSLEGR